MFGYSKKELSWILYDCANSAYSMAITTALFPVYFWNGRWKRDGFRIL